MATIEELVNRIKKEVDDELIEKLNETNNEVDSINKIEAKRKHIVPDTNTDVHGTIIKRSKRNDHDSPGVIVNELKPCYPDLFIYTTRLDEMCLFKRDFNKLNRSDIWEEILRESKPVYSQHKHNITTQKIIKDKNIQKLYNDLKIINDEESLNVFDDEKLSQAKEKDEEMKDISTNKNHRQINVNMFKLKVYKRNSLLIDDTRSSDKSKEILNNSNNQIVSSDISEGRLLFRRENIWNKEFVTVSPESLVLETNKSLMELRKSEIQVESPPVTTCERTTTTSPAPRRILSRARSNRGLTPLERAADPFAAIEQRRIQLEEARVKRLHEFDMERLRMEAERIEVARERKSLLHQLSLLGQQLIDVISNKHQPGGSVPSTDPT